jgi:hypothetical protein
VTTDLNTGTQPSQETGRTPSQSPVSGEAHSCVEGIVGEEQAQLSGGYVQIRALAALAAGLPEVGHEKVSALRLMVLSSSYKPSPEQIAESLFAHMLEQSEKWPRRS